MSYEQDQADLRRVDRGAGSGVRSSAGVDPEVAEVRSVPPSASYQWDNVVIRAGGPVSGLEFSPTVKDRRMRARMLTAPIAARTQASTGFH